MKQQTKNVKNKSARNKPTVNKKSVGIKKQYSKSGSGCKVTFRLPKEAAKGAKTVFLVADFNNWSHTATPMLKLKTGEFKVTLELQQGKEYKFRYLIDGHRWENDWNADQYIRNEYGSDDSLVIV